jgi:hypothetical protein
MLHSIFQILHFKHYKNIKFENSYLIEILFESNDLSLIYFFNNVHNVHLFPFENVKSFEQISF